MVSRIRNTTLRFYPSAIFVGLGLALVLLVLVGLDALDSLLLNARLYADERLAYFGSALFLAPLVPLVIAFALDLQFQGWTRCALRKVLHPSKSVVTDIIQAVLATTQLDSLLRVVFTLGLYQLLTRSASPDLLRIDPLADQLASLHPWLQFILVLLATDLAAYALHRLEHRVRWMWAFHKYHHSATELCILTGSREHPVAGAYSTLLEVLPFLAVGVAVPEFYAQFLPSFIALYLFLGVIGNLYHSDIPWNLGWVGRNILVSPLSHKLHHSIHSQHYGCNLGRIFVFWDRLFGTWNRDFLDKEYMANLTLGVPENRYNRNGFLSDLLLAFSDLAGPTRSLEPPDTPA